jgi:hypothetical protein
VPLMPLMPVESRIGGHIRLLGIFWLAYSAFHLLPGLVLFSMFRHGFPFLGPDVPMFVPGLLRMTGGLFLAGGVLGIVTGWGLLERQSWARTLAIILGCFNLLSMPFGTALGIYTLWVLLPAQSEAEYKKIARAA